MLGVDEGLARQLRALACTAPLHDPDARKSRLDWVDASAYQMAEIAFQAIDQATVAMDFDQGASQANIASRLLPLIDAQVPGRDAWADPAHQRCRAVITGPYLADRHPPRDPIADSRATQTDCSQAQRHLGRWATAKSSGSGGNRRSFVRR
jgi:hypothetical protein